MLWTGFILGLFGGLHWAGMCGPIALAIPYRDGLIPNVVHKSLYNSGRIITYSFMGILAGLIGQGFNMAGWQQILSITLWVLMVFGIIFSGFRNLDVPMIRPIFHLTNTVKKGFSKYLKKRSWGSAVIMGMINGLLPCGLVYIALAASMAGGSVKSAFFYMLVFGIGTVIIMIVVVQVWGRALLHFSLHTIDGLYPASPIMKNMARFPGFWAPKVMQDFVHPS